MAQLRRFLRYAYSRFGKLNLIGHSLNHADYNYFFSVFDKIKIADLEKPSRIIFAFSVHNPAKEHAIKADLRHSVAKLFEDYSIYIKQNRSPDRLLDALTTQGKVLMYEIPAIPGVSTYFR